MKHFTRIVAVIFLFAAISFGQSISVKTYGVSPAVVAQDTILNYFDRPYNGLQNVGVETKVYLAAEMEDGSLSNPNWSVVGKPAGSAASFGVTMDVDTATQIISFIPDMVGVYYVAVNDGSLADTIVIHSALFLGVDGGVVSCHTCHSEKYSEWEQTGHASMLQRGLDGTLSNHYGESCISCHTVGYDLEAENDGFDDFNFVFPDTLFVGQYANMVSMYPDAMARANIQCESCHGPGGEHYSQTNEQRITKTLSAENCAMCHDDGNHHIFPEQWSVSAHASGSHLYAGSSRYSCTPCHNGQGFVDFVEGNPQSVQVTVEITCASCHDPHDATNVNQLRTLEATLTNGEAVVGAGKGALCSNCHKSRQDGEEYVNNYLSNLTRFGPHHGPQTDMLMGTNAYTWGQSLPTSPHLSATEDACVRCHMYDGGSLFYAGSHSFSMVTPDGIDNVEACEDCHGSFGSEFSDKKFFINGSADLDGNGVEEGLQHEVEGIMDILAELLPPYGTTDIDDPDSTWTLDEAGAYFNYLMVEEDRSGGIHNPQFTVGLLYTSIQKLGGTVAIDPSEIGNPVDYSLSQNYPNPFNPTTTIKFSMPEAQNVRLVVYDALGREVEVLINSQMNSGYHEAVWNAGNHASGIYFVKLVAGNFVETKKMLLLK